MRQATMERLMAARKIAGTLGGSLTESGAPRGEQRWYALELPDQPLYETPKLADVERRLAKMNQPAAVRP